MKSNSKFWRTLIAIIFFLTACILLLALLPDKYTGKSYLPFYGEIVMPLIASWIGDGIFALTVIAMLIFFANNAPRVREGDYYGFNDIEKGEIFVITMMRPGHAPGSETTYSMAVRFPDIQDAEYLLCVDKERFSEIPVRGPFYIKYGDKIILHNEYED